MSAMWRMGMSVVLAGALWGGAAMGQSDQPTQAGEQGKAGHQHEHMNKDNGKKGGLSDAARDFMMKSARGNTAEVSMGRLARERAVNRDVKDFGDRMVKDHGRFNEELTRLARKKGVTLQSHLRDATRINEKLKASQAAQR
jgi:putative membrane protein